jgi:hypothetical protein
MSGLNRMIYRLLRRGELPYFKPTGHSTTIGAETFNVLLKDDEDKILMASGITVPTDAGSGFAKGCIFIDTNVGAGSQGVYINVGTKTSCNFDVAGTVAAGSVNTADIADAAVEFAKMQALTTGSIIIGVADVAAALDVKGDGKILVGNGTTATSVAVSGDATLDNAGALTVGANKITPAKMDTTALQYAEVSISSANLVGTSAGQFGHASGVVLVADPGATKVIELVSAVMIYDYDTAAYAAGGNITVNSNGGAALTGLVSAANSVGAAADNITVLMPLAATGATLAKNKGLNLVASAAFTTTGAAGVIRVKVTYRVHTHGLA